MWKAGLIHWKRDEGFTLIEVLASSVILMVISVSLLLALQDSQANLNQSTRHNQATGLASTIAEYIKDADSTSYGTTFTLPLPSTLVGQPVVLPTITVPSGGTGTSGAPSSGPLTASYRYRIIESPVTLAGSTTVYGYDYKIQVYFGDSSVPLASEDCVVNVN